MATNIIHKILSRLIEIKPEETLSSFFLFCYFFFLTFSIYIVKPVKISLFLKRLGPENLPYAYLFTALLIGFAVTLNLKLLHSRKRSVYISISLTFFILNLVIFWVLFQTEIQGISLIYWFWSDIFAATSITQFWILVNDIYNPHQAKKIIGFLVSGGLLGGIGGSLLSSLMAEKIGTENLLLICPVLLIFCLFIIVSIRKKSNVGTNEEDQSYTKQKKKKIEYGKSFQLIWRNRHLLILSGIMASTIIVATLIDFQFNTIVKNTYENTDLRTSFLGTFFTLLLFISYLLHILLTSRVLRNYGIRVALMIAPLFLLACSIAIFFIPAAFMIYWACLTKGGEKSLAHSLTQSVRELLYIPVSPDIKYKAKMFIDMFVSKCAKGFGALILLVFISAFNFSMIYISIVTICFILVWGILNLLITKEYVSIVKENLKIKWLDADKYIKEKIDMDVTKLVFDTVESKKRSSTLYAMNLYDLAKSKNLNPELRKAISYRTDEIKAESMNALFELDGEILIPAEEGKEDERLNDQIKEIMSMDIYKQFIKRHMDRVMSDQRENGGISKMEIAKAMGMIEADPEIIRKLSQLLKEESLEVLQYALENAGKLKKREFVPLIIKHLGKPYTQRIASKALISYGKKIVGTLKDYLGAQEEDLDIRKEIPDIIAEIGTQKSADLLIREMRKEKHDLKTEIIDALYKIRAGNSLIRFDEQIINKEILLLIKKCYLILLEMNDLLKDKKKAFLAKELEMKLAQQLKQLFKLISLIYSEEEVIKAYQNISSGEKKDIDYSIELLDNILPKNIKEYFFPLIEEIPFEYKVKKCRKMLKNLEK
ncbi:MAG: Npt1/Npt2 family nucleotide transporter [Candidatus Aminicenantaceae bacterium]